jgi:hypothetical protein
MLTKRFFREIGKKGGQVKTKKGFAWLTPKQAHENARRAALARWSGVPPKPKEPTALGKLEAALRRTQRRTASLKRLIAAAKEEAK